MRLQILDSARDDLIDGSLRSAADFERRTHTQHPKKIVLQLPKIYYSHP
jgi:hypothetical protein